jgi:hypothetical protein
MMQGTIFNDNINEFQGSTHIKCSTVAIVNNTINIDIDIDIDR